MKYHIKRAKGELCDHDGDPIPAGDSLLPDYLYDELVNCHPGKDKKDKEKKFKAKWGIKTDKRKPKEGKP